MAKRIVLADNLNGGGGLVKFKIRNKSKIETGYIYESAFMSTFQGTEFRFYPEATISKGIYVVLGKTYYQSYNPEYKKFEAELIKQYKIEKIEFQSI